VNLGKPDGVLPALAEPRGAARSELLKVNQTASCPACPREPPASKTKEAAA